MIDLILGGARSGKSRLAEQRALGSQCPVVYIATAESRDGEMNARIAHHRERRPAEWLTVEEPLHLAAAIRQHAHTDNLILVDCLTLWLSNLMHAERDPDIETRRLTRFLGVALHPIVFVSNEVGMGLVPDTPLGRTFRDAQGRLNQAVAAAVPNVAFVAAGLPLWLKRDATQES